MNFTAKDNNNYSIKKAIYKDAQKLLDYMKLMTYQSQDFISVDINEVSSFTLSFEQDFLANINGHMFVVCDEHDNFIASADLRYSKRNSVKHVCSFGISVLKDYQGIGVGYNLLKFIIKKAVEDNKEKIELDVISNNDKAISLYKKLGFEVEGVKVNSIIKNNKKLDLVFMGMQLNKN